MLLSTNTIPFIYSKTQFFIVTIVFFPFFYIFVSLFKLIKARISIYSYWTKEYFLNHLLNNYVSETWYIYKLIKITPPEQIK